MGITVDFLKRQSISRWEMERRFMAFAEFVGSPGEEDTPNRVLVTQKKEAIV